MRHRFSLAQRLLFILAGTLGSALIAVYYLTVRIRNTPGGWRLIRQGPRKGGIFAFWHAHQLSAVWHLRAVHGHVLISASKDGEYIARIASALGFRPIRGSSSRGGVSGLLELVRRVSEGAPVGITPDGPRGPRYSVHRGVLNIARRSGRPITPFAIGLSHYWELPSWDRFRIPKPFSRGVLCTGEPIPVPSNADEATLDRVAEELRASLLALEARADTLARRGT